MTGGGEVCGAREKEIPRKKRAQACFMFAIVYQIGWIINLIYNSRYIHELTWQ